MASRRAVLIPLVLSAALFSLCTLIFSGFTARAASGYGVLTVPEAVDEAELVDRLEKSGIRGIVSESAQWVYIEDYTGMKKVPLADYGEHIEPYDPRNTGYAEVLREAFVSEGKRRLFIPLGMGGALFDGFDKKLVPLLDGVEHSFAELGGTWPAQFRWVLFFLALVPAIPLSGMPWTLVAAAPVLASLSIGGPGGLVLSGLICGGFRLGSGWLQEVLGSWSRGSRGILSILRRSIPWCDMAMPAIFLAAAAATCAFAPIDAHIALLAVLAFCAIRCSVLWITESRGAEHGHIRFSPLTMIPDGKDYLQAARAMLPFAAAGFLSLLSALPVFGQRQGLEGHDPDAFPHLSVLPGLDEYRNHMKFQEEFSMLPLPGTEHDNSGAEDGYLQYRLDDAGLIDPSPGRPSPLERGDLDLPPLESFLRDLPSFPRVSPVPVLLSDGLTVIVSVGAIGMLGLRGRSRTKRLRRTFRISDRSAAA